MAITTIATTIATAVTLSSAVITENQVSLKAAPRDSAKQQTVMWQGEVVEVRGYRMNYLQVYDHKRERAGYIRADQVRITNMEQNKTYELLPVIKFIQDTPGSEALGIALSAAYIKAAGTQDINGVAGAEVLSAIGTFAERLAQKSSSSTPLSKNGAMNLSAQMDVASQYGIKFQSYEVDDHIQVCYEGEVYRQLLGMKKASPEQKAQAALGLTKPECMDQTMQPLLRAKMELWRLDILDLAQTEALPAYLRNKIEMRRAGILSNLSYYRIRSDEVQGGEASSPINIEAATLAQRAIDALSVINQEELLDEDLSGFNDAAMLVNSSRWATITLSATPASSKSPRIVKINGQSGETCAVLVDEKHDINNPLAKKCTYGHIWEQSSSINRESNALALAVQPMSTWREMWVFRKANNGWFIQVLPPSSSTPGLGYAEFAGWVPGGKQILVARESRGDGKYKRSFEVINLDTMGTERQAQDPTILGAFQRWQDINWKAQTLSVR